MKCKILSKDYFKDRGVFYSTVPIRDQAQKGDWDFKLEAVYGVVLLEFNFNKEPEIHEFIDNQSYSHSIQL